MTKKEKSDCIEFRERIVEAVLDNKNDQGWIHFPKFKATIDKILTEYKLTKNQPNGQDNNKSS